MIKFELTEITTKDNLVHQGIFFRPSKPQKRAILWIHGLADTFYGDVKTFEVLTQECEKLGWGFASFNTRGHDVITSTTKLDPSSPKGKTHSIQGAACEKFVDCVYDIDAAISFLEKEGFSEVIIIGISTGANKACHYEATTHDPRVVGVVLASPISDVGFKKKELGPEYEKTIAKVKKLVEEGKGDNFVEGLDYMPITPHRFLSAYEENSEEDVFPYYQPNPTFTKYASIEKPLMVVLGANDEYADMPVAGILNAFKKFQHSTNFKGTLMADAFHSFGEKEKEFVREIIDWAKTII